MHMRAKIYGVNDMSLGFSLQRTEEVINAFDPGASDRDINEILEYYNIALFFEKKLYLLKWDDAVIKKYTDTVKRFRGVIGRFFHLVQGEDLSELYERVERQFKSDFVSALAKYRVTDRISNDQFSLFIDNTPQAMAHIIHEKKLVLKYGQVIAEHLSSDVEYAELVIDHYFVMHNKPSHKTYMPEELKPEQKESIISNYVEWDGAKANYLNVISGLKKADGYPIDDRVRLKAHRRVQAYWKSHFEKGGKAFQYGATVSFSDQDLEVIEEFDNEKNDFHFFYSKKWIEDNLDFPTLLNNFIYLFRFVDLNCRCKFLSNPTDLSIIEKTLGIHGKNEYPIGVGYDSARMWSFLQMRAYQAELQQYHINVEDLFKYFFEENLKEEFGVTGFSYCSPSEQASNLEKILLIASQIDAVIKQYRLYLEDGSIDRELFEFSSVPYKIVDTPSMIQNKYLYANSDDIKRDLYYLFSDQCMLSYTEKTGETYDSFAKVLQHGDIRFADYPEYLHGDLNWLIQRGTVFFDVSGFLRINETLLHLLFDLYRNGCIALSYCNKAQKDVVESLLEKKDVVVESTLFTRQEQQYLDYMLNVQQFNNGPELRNKYVHGTFSLSPDVHNNDYIELLKIMTLIVIKINEEFCLKYPLEK